MKIICFIEPPTEFVREELANRSFARSRNAENNGDHDTLICLRLPRLPTFSTRNAMRTKVLGASGSGKSSVVRAGLLPRLSQLIGARFRYLILVPDVNP